MAQWGYWCKKPGYKLLGFKANVNKFGAKFQTSNHLSLTGLSLKFLYLL